MVEGQGHTCFEIGAISYFGWNHNGLDKIMKSHQFHDWNSSNFMYEIHGISWNMDMEFKPIVSSWKVVSSKK